MGLLNRKLNQTSAPPKIPTKTNSIGLSLTVLPYQKIAIFPSTRLQNTSETNLIRPKKLTKYRIMNLHFTRLRSQQMITHLRWFKKMGSAIHNRRRVANPVLWCLAEHLSNSSTETQAHFKMSLKKKLRKV